MQRSYGDVGPVVDYNRYRKGKRINLKVTSLFEARSSSIEALASLGQLYGWGKCGLSTQVCGILSAAHQPRIAQDRAPTSFVH
jgi:hypothetical protein